MKKVVVIGFRVSPKRKALYQRLAAVDELKVSEWLRRIADQKLAEATADSRIDLNDPL